VNITRQMDSTALPAHRMATIGQVRNMKKIFLLLIIFLAVATQANSRGFETVIPYYNSAAAAPGGGTVHNCPDATYDFAWTGDNTGAPDTSAYGCFANGTSSADATNNDSVTIGATGVTGNGASVDATDDQLCWTIDKAVDVGTVWYSLKSITLPTGNASIVNLNNLTSSVRTVLRTDGTYSGYYIDAGANSTWTGDAIIDETWARIGYSWDKTNDDHSIIVCNDNDCSMSGAEVWEEDLNDTMGTVASNFSRICIGESAIGSDGTSSGREQIIDDLYFIYGTYKANDPKP